MEDEEVYNEYGKCDDVDGYDEVMLVFFDWLLWDKKLCNKWGCELVNWLLYW